MTARMGKALTHGQTVISSSGSTKMARKADRALTYGTVVTSTLENSKMTPLVGKVLLHLLMEEYG